MEPIDRTPLTFRLLVNAKKDAGHYGVRLRRHV